MTDNRAFWKKSSGITAAIFLAAIASGLTHLAVNYLPSFETILQNNWYLGIVVGILSLVVFAVIDPSVRTIIQNAYMSAMRAITGVFIKMDPIARLKSYLDDLAENINDLSIQIGQLRGEMRSLRTIIDKNDAGIKQNLLLAEKAKANNNQKDLILTSRKAGRLKESNKKYFVLEKQMRQLYKILTRMYEHSEILHEDTQDQVSIKEIEYKAILASSKAMKGAKSIINGSSKKELFDQSMQYILDDLSRKSGEMERFMDLSKDYMDTMDLENAEFENDGLQLLENFESSILVDAGILDINQKPKRQREELDREDEKEEGSSYDDLF